MSFFSMQPAWSRPKAVSLARMAVTLVSFENSSRVSKGGRGPAAAFGGAAEEEEEEEGAVEGALNAAAAFAGMGGAALAVEAAGSEGRGKPHLSRPALGDGSAAAAAGTEDDGVGVGALAVEAAAEALAPPPPSFGASLLPSSPLPGAGPKGLPAPPARLALAALPALPLAAAPPALPEPPKKDESKGLVEVLGGAAPAAVPALPAPLPAAPLEEPAACAGGARLPHRRVCDTHTSPPFVASGLAAGCGADACVKTFLKEGTFTEGAAAGCCCCCCCCCGCCCGGGCRGRGALALAHSSEKEARAFLGGALGSGEKGLEEDEASRSSTAAGVGTACLPHSAIGTNGLPGEVMGLGGGAAAPKGLPAPAPAPLPPLPPPLPPLASVPDTALATLAPSAPKGLPEPEPEPAPAPLPPLLPPASAASVPDTALATRAPSALASAGAKGARLPSRDARALASRGALCAKGRLCRSRSRARAEKTVGRASLAARPQASSVARSVSSEARSASSRSTFCSSVRSVACCSLMVRIREDWEESILPRRVSLDLRRTSSFFFPSVPSALLGARR